MWTRLKAPYSLPVAGESAIMIIALGRYWAWVSFAPWTAEPFIGEVGQVEQVEEWKVELVVADELIRPVVEALKQSHPYETPAYEVWRLEEF